MPRIRVRIGKLGKCAFLSHLDTVRALERAIRRSGLRLAFSEGFHPHPKISFAAPLPVGVTSEGEVADIEFASAVEPDEVREKLARQLPEGLEIDRAIEVTPSGRSLMSMVAAARYAICIPSGLLGPCPLDEGISRLLERDSLTITRERKGTREVVDVRPLIFGIETTSASRCASEIEACLATGSRGNLRPSDLVTALSECGIISRETTGISMRRLEILVRQGGSLVAPI